MMPIESLRRGTLWLFLAVSAFASIEPSPYEAMFFVAIVVFFKGGMRFDKAQAPMIFALAMFCAAALIALAPYAHESESVSFTGISIYISFTTVLFAAIVAERPTERMAVVRSGYIAAGLIAAALGVAGYLDIGGLAAYFTAYDGARAMGPFKDPNVFGPFLVAPVAWLGQDVLLGRARFLTTAPAIALLFVAIFLSFSRGAIIDVTFAGALLLAVTFLTSPSATDRNRTLKVAGLCVLFVAFMLAIMLAIPSIRETALERGTLTEDYDSGEQGRFGNQIRSIPLLLDRPLGFGPFRFVKFFPADPHEVFLSAFASFGWIGGLAFLVFIAVTLYIGWSLCFRRSSLQSEIIAVWSALFPQILQGVQIDTAHWRHLFLLCGCLFGLASAVRLERARPVAAPQAARAPTGGRYARASAVSNVSATPSASFGEMRNSGPRAPDARTAAGKRAPSASTSATPIRSAASPGPVGAAP